MYDPNPDVYRVGYEVLLKQGVVVRDFAPELRAQVVGANSLFVRHYLQGLSNEEGRGTARFDPTQNDFTIISADGRLSFPTSWHVGPGGSASIHIGHVVGTFNFNGTQNAGPALRANATSSTQVASAKGSDEFGSIDDPDALSYNTSSVSVKTGNLVVYKSKAPSSFVIIKIVQFEHETNPQVNSLSISWEIRARRD